MREMTYIIKGDPVPLARARIGRTRMWDPQKELKICASLALQNQHGTAPLFGGPLEVVMTFYMAAPVHARKRRLVLGHWHHSRPDLDNLIKFVADIANGIIYRDDATISAIHASKLYSLQPCTKFTIREITYEPSL